MATARFVLKGENQLKGTLNEAKQDLTGFQSVIGNAGAALAKAFTVTAVVAGLKQLGSAIKDVAKEGSEFQAAVGNLQTALGVSDQEMRDFTKSLNKLDDQTKANRLDLIGYAQSFKAFDLSTQQVEKLLQASINLSNVTGGDLSTAISAVQRSLTGSTTALERMGVEVDNLTEAQLKNGEIADILIGKYGELSDAMQIGDSQQTLNNISDTLTRIKQDLGTGIVNAVAPALETIYDWLLKIEGWVEDQNEKRRVSAYTDAVDMVGRTTIGSLANYYGVSGEDIISAYNGVTRYDKTMRNNVWSAIDKTGIPINELIAEWQSAMSNMQMAYAKVYGIPELPSSAVINPGFGTAGFSVTTDAFGRNALAFNPNNLSEDTLYNLFNPETPTLSNPGFGTAGFSVTTDAFGRNALANVSTLAEDVIYNLFNKVDEVVEEAVDNTNWDYVAAFGIADAKSGFTMNKPFSLNNGFRNVLELPVTAVSQSTLDNIYGFEDIKRGQGKSDSKDSKGSGNQNIDEFSKRMMELSGKISESVTGLETFKNVINPLTTIFEAFATEVGSLVNQLLEPLSDVLKWIGTSLADTLVPIFKALMPAVQAVVTIIKSVLTPVLDGLTWVFEQVAAGLLLITGTLQWAADWIAYGIGKATFWTDSDNTSKPGSWSSYALGGGYTDGSITASTQTAVASAAYTGGNNITINIYQSGAVVGDSGMRQFAQMIKNEFDELNYYGVA